MRSGNINLNPIYNYSNGLLICCVILMLGVQNISGSTPFDFTGCIGKPAPSGPLVNPFLGSSNTQLFENNRYCMGLNFASANLVHEFTVTAFRYVKIARQERQCLDLVSTIWDGSRRDKKKSADGQQYSCSCADGASSSILSCGSDIGTKCTNTTVDGVTVQNCNVCSLGTKIVDNGGCWDGRNTLTQAAIKSRGSFSTRNLYSTDEGYTQELCITSKLWGTYATGFVDMELLDTISFCGITTGQLMCHYVPASSDVVPNMPLQFYIGNDIEPNEEVPGDFSYFYKAGYDNTYRTDTTNMYNIPQEQIASDASEYYKFCQNDVFGQTPSVDIEAFTKNAVDRTKHNKCYKQEADQAIYMRTLASVESDPNQKLSNIFNFNNVYSVDAQTIAFENSVSADIDINYQLVYQITPGIGLVDVSDKVVAQITVTSVSCNTYADYNEFTTCTAHLYVTTSDKVVAIVAKLYSDVLDTYQMTQGINIVTFQLAGGQIAQNNPITFYQFTVINNTVTYNTSITIVQGTYLDPNKPIDEGVEGGAEVLGGIFHLAWWEIFIIIIVGILVIVATIFVIRCAMASKGKGFMYRYKMWCKKRKMQRMRDEKEMEKMMNEEETNSMYDVLEKDSSII